MSTRAISMMKAGGIYEDEAPRPTGFVENLSAAFDVFVTEDVSSAETRAWYQPLQDSLNEISRVTGKSQYKPEFNPGQQGTSGMDLELNKRKLQQAEEDPDVRAARFQGNLSAKSYEDIATEIEVQSSLLRQRQERVARYATGWGKLGEFGGYMGGAMTDFVNIAALPFGAGAANLTSKSVLANMGRVFATEAAVGVAAETLIQPQVFAYKRQIDSPYTVQDAGINVLAAGVGAGLFGAGTYGSIEGIKAAIRGPARSVRGQVDEAADAGDILPDDDVLAAADVQDDLEEMMTDVNPLDPSPEGDAAHMDALQKSSDDLANDMPVDVEGINANVRPEQIDPLADALDESKWTKVRPTELEIDAETFQFKTGGDQYGVNERLQGVTTWEDDLVGSAIVWERADGKRFIVDGHQRTALANRLVGEGLAKPESMEMPARILRERDGITANEAMSRAALKNISEGTGTAIDASRVLRSLDPKTRHLMPKLPPNWALVRDSRGLSRLGDDAFRMAVDDRVPESYAAMVGDYFEDHTEQLAAMQVLERAEPANRTQAEIMINQVRAAGFERQITEDLFGEREIVESLVKERARILDGAMKRIRRDEKLFQVMVERETEINGHGNNQLDTEANQARFSADQDALATLIADSNKVGFVSEQLNKASTRLKNGSTVKKEIDTFLNKYRKQLEIEQKKTDKKLTPKKGKHVNKSDLTRKEWDRAERLLLEGQAGRDVDTAMKLAEKNQKTLGEIGKRIQAKYGDDYYFANPGIKKRNTVIDKIDRKNYSDAGEMTDIVRAGFIVDDIETVNKMTADIAQELELLNEGVKLVKVNGYFDQKLLVRFPDGTVGEVQFWDRHLLIAKEGAQDWIPEKFREGIEPPETPGHVYYEEIRDLTDPRKKQPPEAEARIDELNALSREIYGKAGQLAHKSWKSSAGIESPESQISAAEALSQVAPTSSSRINQPLWPDDTMAGRLSQDQYDSISSVETGNAGSDINVTSKRIIDEAAQEDNLLFANLQQVLADNPDLDIPVRIDATGEAEVAQTMKAGDLFDELDAREKAINDTITCMTGGAA